MAHIHVVADNSQITVLLDKREASQIEAIRDAIKILTREVIKYEHGIDIDTDW